MHLGVDLRALLPYCLPMTIQQLREIIALHIHAAQAGCPQAQGQVAEARAEVDRLEAEERAEFGGFTREELTDFSCLTDEEMAGEW